MKFAKPKQGWKKKGSLPRIAVAIVIVQVIVRIKFLKKMNSIIIEHTGKIINKKMHQESQMTISGTALLCNCFYVLHNGLSSSGSTSLTSVS